MARNKRFLYKIYDSSGNFLATLTDVVSDPDFSKNINGSLSELTVTLAKKIGDFGELDTISFNNLVKVRCFDSDADKVLLHSCNAYDYDGTWSASNDADSLSTDTGSIVFRGWGSVQFNVDVSKDAGNNFATLTNSSMASKDLSLYEDTGSLKAHLYFPITDFSEFTSVTLRWGSDASNYWEKTVTQNESGAFQNGWNTLAFPWTSATPTGSPDSSGIDFLEVVLNYTGSQIDITSMRLDWIEFIADSCVQGVQVYSGRLTRYTPTISGKKEYVELTFLPNMMELANYALEDADGNTKFTRSTEDPADMLKYVLDRFTAEGGTVDYDGISITATGNTETYEFSSQSYLEAVEAIVGMCPTRWYSYIDSDDVVHLKPKGVAADHKFKLGQTVEDFKAIKNIEDVINVIYFTGGSQVLDDQTNTTKDTTVNLGDGTDQYWSQQFTPTQTPTIGATIQIESFVGTYAGDLIFSIQKNNGSDEPDGTKLIELIIANATVLDIALDTDYVVDLLADLVDLNDSQTYHLVIESSTSDASNYVKLRADSGAGYAGGVLKKSTDAVTWSAEAKDLYFKIHYGQTLYKKYTRTDSVTNWGTHAVFRQDERITTEATMDALAERILDDNENPEIRMIVKVIDNSQDGNGYDIESIEPGDIINMRNLIETGYSRWDLGLWDEMYWDESISNVQERMMQIVSVQYAPDYATITVSSKTPRVAETIEQINRDLKASQTSSNPDSPESVTI